MVSLQCRRFQMTKVGTHIGGRLTDDNIDVIVLAMSDVEKVKVDDLKGRRGNPEYFHKLPDIYPEKEFAVCVGADEKDHRYINLYEESMKVYVVREIPEVAVISNEAIYFESGKFELDDLYQNTTNYCEHDYGVTECLEKLFEPP